MNTIKIFTSICECGYAYMCMCILVFRFLRLSSYHSSKFMNELGVYLDGSTRKHLCFVVLLKPLNEQINNDTGWGLE